MTNEQKADEICKRHIFDSNHFDCCMEMAQWKDEQYKQNNSIFINYLKEWAQGWLIEQLTAFAQHLNKRGAFCDDLCMDFEHEAQSFIELREYLKKT